MSSFLLSSFIKRTSGLHRPFDTSEWRRSTIDLFDGIAPMRPKKKPKTKRTPNRDANRPRCGLCGKSARLTRTDCCGNWICDDEHTYVLFSYARNSCSRTHRRFTLCSHHFNEGHTGRWQDCTKCRDSFETEMYVWCGTNEYNFEKLQNPPAFEPTHCSKCNRVIKLGEDGYTVRGKEYLCARCAAKEFGSMSR